MSEHSGAPTTFRDRLRWLMTPPQAYLAYLLAVLLIGGLSFYAGSRNPKLSRGVVPQGVTAPASPQPASPQ